MLPEGQLESKLGHAAHKAEAIQGRRGQLQTVLVITDTKGKTLAKPHAGSKGCSLYCLSSQTRTDRRRPLENI